MFSSYAQSSNEANSGRFYAPPDIIAYFGRNQGN